MVSPRAIKAVLFDFHATLVDGGDPSASLDAAWARSGRGGTAEGTLGTERFSALAQRVNHLWDHVREVDPECRRDLSPEIHRKVHDALILRLPDVDAALAQAFYEVMPDQWTPFEDTLPTLTELKRRGLRLALVSNTSIDLRPTLAHWNLLEPFDAVILSCEAGTVKPHAPIFQRALDALDATADQALMVGDNPFEDAGAVALGIRTLLLPNTEGRSHGLGLVLRLTGG